MSTYWTFCQISKMITNICIAVWEKTMTSDKYVIEKMDHSFGQITYPNCRASCIQNSNYNQMTITSKGGGVW